MPAAGVPWFVTIFGRDSLIVALQAMIVNPHLARGALGHLAKYQAKERDDWRDAQPRIRSPSLKRSISCVCLIVGHAMRCGYGMTGGRLRLRQGVWTCLAGRKPSIQTTPKPLRR
jgi:hypothetical protein